SRTESSAGTMHRPPRTTPHHAFVPIPARRFLAPPARHAKKRGRSRAAAVLAVLLACAWAPPSAAQGPVGGAAAAPVDARAQRDVDAALAQWAKAKDGGEPERARALRRLAPCDDPRVTEALLDELDRAGVQPFAAQVLEAIGRRPRGNIVPKLRPVLLQDAAGEFVRRAAAVALGRQGSPGADLLPDCARGDLDVKEAVRDAALDGLAAADDERAWRGLAPLALKGGTHQQLRVLRLLDPAKDIAAVTQVRLRLLHEGDAELAAT